MKFVQIIISLLFFTVAFSETQVNNYVRLNDGVQINLQQGRIKLQPYSENIIRVTYSLSDFSPNRESLMIIKSDRKSVNWELKETKKTLSFILPIGALFIFSTKKHQPKASQNENR